MSDTLLRSAIKDNQALRSLPAVSGFVVNKNDKLVERLRRENPDAFDLLSVTLDDLRNRPCCATGCTRLGSHSCPKCRDGYKVPFDELEYFCSQECFNASYKDHKANVHSKLDAIAERRKREQHKNIKRAAVKLQIANEAYKSDSSDNDHDVATRKAKSVNPSEQAMIEMEIELAKLLSSERMRRPPPPPPLRSVENSQQLKVRKDRHAQDSDSDTFSDSDDELPRS